MPFPCRDSGAPDACRLQLTSRAVTDGNALGFASFDAEFKPQQQALNAKLRGHYQYYGRPTNYRSLCQLYRGVRRLWSKWLNRRTRGRHLPWERYEQLLRRYPLLCPRITHAWVAR